MADSPTDTSQNNTTADTADKVRDLPQQHRGPKRNRALDGLAGLAIIGVLGYGLGIPGISGGHLGLVMLLTIGGYTLTSSQLLRVRKGIRAIGQLWRRDIAMLWPPMAIMCAVTAVICLFFQHPLLEAAQPDALPSLALVENLASAFRGVTPLGAGETVSPVSPFSHLWFISLCAQFCLLRPIVVQVAYAALPTKRHARRLTLALAIVSALGMGLLFWDGQGLSRAYFGPDARAFAPLLGAWLAYAIPLDGHPSRDVRALASKLRPTIEVAGIFSLAALVTCMHDLPVDSVLLYRGGMFVAALLTLAVIATVILPGGLVTALVSLRPLRWLGARSICIYLWHLPIFCLLGITEGAPWWFSIIGVALTLAAAEATHRVLAAMSRVHLPVADTERPRTMVHRPVMLASSLVAGALALALVGTANGMSLPFTSSNDEAEAVEQTEEQPAPDENPQSAQEGDVEEQAKRSEPLRIMLIGNSFTFYNDLAGKLGALTNAKIDQETKGAAHLSDHLDASSELGAMTLGALDKGPWDYVVIQEMSTAPMDDREQFLSDIKKLCDIVREKGATPIIYATWAYDSTSLGAAAHNMTIQEMGDALKSSFDEAGSITSAPVAQVGAAFAERNYDSKLYAPDGKHPSDAGTQLAAEVIAQTIEDDIKQA